MLIACGHRRVTFGFLLKFLSGGRGTVLVTRPNRPRTDIVRLQDAHTRASYTRVMDTNRARLCLGTERSQRILNISVRANAAASLEKTSSNGGHRYLGQSFMTQLIDTSGVNFIMDSLA